MNRRLTAASVFVATLLFLAACGSTGGDLSRADTQRRFGVRMAKMDLWREAMFRFKRATEIEPDNAMAHNNLAVAYEATGNFDDAAREYREALRLDRSNQYIQKNYSRFVEFSQRSKKRDSAATTSAASPSDAKAPQPAPPPAPQPTAGTPPPETATAPPATTTDPPPPSRPPQEASR